jgi:hypothetical protein
MGMTFSSGTGTMISWWAGRALINYMAVID